MDPRDTIDSRDNAEAEQMIYDMIRVGDPGKDAEDEISSYLNPSGDGMEVPSDGPSEDDAENDPERIVGPLIKSAEVHILLSPMVTLDALFIYIYILTISLLLALRIEHIFYHDETRPGQKVGRSSKVHHRRNR